MENHNLDCWCNICFFAKLENPELENGFRELKESYEEGLTEV